jgi:tetratricopeptide (TPR) repeat protein
LRAWAALGARAQQREQDELYQKGNAAYGQCDYAAVERVIAQMAPGAQRGALESALRTARAREAEMHAAYQRGQAFVTQGNNAFRQGRPAGARSLYEQALRELRAARQNAVCAKDQAIIDTAITAVQRNIARAAAAPAPPSPPSSTRPAPADDQFCRDLYNRGLTENRNGRALYQQGDRAGAQAAYQRALAMFERGLGDSRCVGLRSQFSHAVDVVRNNLRIIGAAPAAPEPRASAPGTPGAADDQYCRTLFDRGRTLNLEANQLRQRGDTGSARARYQQALAAFQQGAADRRCTKYSGEFTRAVQTVTNNLRVLATAPTPTPPPATAPSGASRIFAQPQYRGYRINDDGTRFAAEKFCRLNGYTRVGRIAYEQASPPTISIMRDDISRYGTRQVFRAIECVR